MVLLPACSRCMPPVGGGEAVAAALGVPGRPHEERAFQDGAHKSRPLASVRRRGVYVLQSCAATTRRAWCAAS